VFDVNNQPNDASDPVTIRYVDTTNSDFGDAPAPYPTLVLNNGPFHRRTSLFLGAGVDAELDGLPNATATGDDVNGSDDEDGILFPMTHGGQFPTGATTSSFIATASAAGFLDAWIDFNQDGDWNDAGERIANKYAVTAGRNLVPFTLPAGAMAGTTFARFRLSSVGGLAVTGPAADGEVEDHAVTLVGGAAKEISLQAHELGMHQVTVSGGALVVSHQGTTYASVPAGELTKLTATLGDGSVRYALTDVAGLPGSIVDPGAGGLVSLQVTAASFSLTQYGASKLTGVQAIDLRGSGANTLLVRRPMWGI
jgi:hypothetical protein